MTQVFFKEFYDSFTDVVSCDHFMGTLWTHLVDHIIQRGYWKVVFFLLYANYLENHAIFKATCRQKTSVYNVDILHKNLMKGKQVSLKTENINLNA